MTLTVLTENCAGSKCLAEHGVSYLIEHEGKTVLFDAGHTDVFIKNAKTLGIDIRSKVDAIVLSHGHWDHGDGLRYLKDKTLITHPGSFIKRFGTKHHANLGLKLSKNEMEQKFDLILKDTPYYISDTMVFLGQIPKLNDFEAQTTPFTDALGQPDYVIDDSALVIIDNNALIVVSGCSHSGICNIMEYAIKVTGVTRVKAVLGGFHLKENNEQTKRTIDFIRKKSITKVYPSHCTAFPALVAFYEAFQTESLKTGIILNF
ncbi:MBL fold metallo-hydrolase [Mariniflexile ostreae]|uniref:MBL fold metallo-hydrolase n=1 Tax=Mariniflexile ostreae TaxID=1520892 RepID=A0ABV5F851_9FLAO